MTDDTSNTTANWFKRLTQTIAGEPRDRAQLIEVLSEAGQRGLIDQDAPHQSCPPSACLCWLLYSMPRGLVTHGANGRRKISIP